MTIDYRKSVDVPMIDERTGEVAFVVQVYGRTAAELQTVPNAVVSSLAERYPGFTSSPFMLKDRNLMRPVRYEPFLLGHKVIREPYVEPGHVD